MPEANFPWVPYKPPTTMLWHLWLSIPWFFFAKNMIKLIVKIVEAGPLRKLTECMRVTLNMPQIWLHGFELAINHHCNNSCNLWSDKLLKNVQRLCTLQNWWKYSFWQLMVSQITLMSDTKYPWEKILNLSSFVQKIKLKLGREHQIYCDL